MYLLYLDESANESDPADRYFVLGGAAIFERVTYHISNTFDRIQATHFPGLEPIEFHATEIRSGRGFWRKVVPAKRDAVLQDIAGAISHSNAPGVVLFAAAIEKSESLYGEQAVEFATEQICNRFDLFLMRRREESKDLQRGLLIFSKGRFDKRAGIWVRNFRKLGTQWGSIRNLCDIPYFASTKESRMLQLADFVAHAVYLAYERADDTLLKPILTRFDQKDGVVHGLVHARTNTTVRCACPACSSRRP